MTMYISIHASRGGSDLLWQITAIPAILFQSTLPVGEATTSTCRCGRCRSNFNPRFPWGKRREQGVRPRNLQHFNPRFPWGKRPHEQNGGCHLCAYFNPRFPWGKRPVGMVLDMLTEQFQSTLPVGEATGVGNLKIIAIVISIHASRGGSDCRVRAELFCLIGISIHASRGGSDDYRRGQYQKPDCISIHASRGGSDLLSAPLSRSKYPFQSTLPVGEATFVIERTESRPAISIHASRGGSDISTLALMRRKPYFNPRFPWGKRRNIGNIGNIVVKFQSTLPVGEAT